ncbi:MAG: hypothetical protein ABTQ73_00070 [Caldilineales bacterium]
MYNVVLLLHSLLRWVVVVVGLVALFRALSGRSGNRRWDQLDTQLGIAFTSALDLNLLFGLLLYVVLSPITSGAFKDMAAAMGNSVTRFFLMEHGVLMLVAVVVAHIGRSRTKKAASDQAKFKQTALFFGLALLIILLAVPWPFLAAGSGRGWL